MERAGDASLTTHAVCTADARPGIIPVSECRGDGLSCAAVESAVSCGGWLDDFSSPLAAVMYKTHGVFRL